MPTVITLVYGLGFGMFLVLVVTRRLYLFNTIYGWHFVQCADSKSVVSGRLRKRGDVSGPTAAA